MRGRQGDLKGWRNGRRRVFFFKTDGWEGKGGGQGYEWL